MALELYEQNPQEIEKVSLYAPENDTAIPLEPQQQNTI